MLPVQLPRSLVERLESARPLDGPGRWLARTADAAVPSERVRALLQGRAVGHPLHAAMSDVPVGAWLSSLALDLRFPRQAHEPAGWLLRLALVSAVPTALAGLADYLRLDAPGRRVGAAHVLANSTGLGLGLASLGARRRGRRLAGTVLSAAGLSVLGAGAFLGGHLAARLDPPEPLDPEPGDRELGQLRATDDGGGHDPAARTPGA